MLDTTAPKTRWCVAAVLGTTGLALLVGGAERLSADIVDIPGNVAAEALEAGRPLAPENISTLLRTRTRSVESHPTAARWFTIGHAYLVSGNARNARGAYANGLFLDPGRGASWAAYARALEHSGDRPGAAAARAYSIRRAPHDPVARRFRTD